MDTSMLSSWDAAIVERFAVLRTSRPSDGTVCTLTLDRGWLACLDRTLDQLRQRARPSGADPSANGAERRLLRSAAVEVTAGAYADGLRRRRRAEASVSGRDSRAVAGNRTASRGAVSALRERVEARRGPALAPVSCVLSPALLGDLDGVVEDMLGADPTAPAHQAPGQAVALEDARSVVVEAAVVSWLILRGASAAPTARGPAPGWLAAVRHLAARRRHRRG